jgi:uncharacterized protein YehS (DUF1456 family)
MNHNDVMRSLRYMLKANDQKMAEIIGLAGLEVNAEAIAGYVKKEEEPGFVRCPDKVMAYFLDGLVIFARQATTAARHSRRAAGDQQHHPQEAARGLRAEGRRPARDPQGGQLPGVQARTERAVPQGRPHNYRPCGDQLLRNFLKGLTLRVVADATHCLAGRLRALLLQGEVRHPAPAATGARRAGRAGAGAAVRPGRRGEGEQVSHVWLLFLFHQALEDKPRLKVRPPRLGGNKSMGVFATRATHRPNGIGQSVVRLEGSSLGACCFPASTCSTARRCWISNPTCPMPTASWRRPTDRQRRTRADRRAVEESALQQAHEHAQRLDEPLVELIEQCLAQDPRPAYQVPPVERVYGVQFWDVDVRWHYPQPDQIRVLEVVRDSSLRLC